ncbi:ribosome recycling factor [Buchnera aphidicola]|uniref:ribosome recycling factor n=1 Tax=Buchnera aphidicola TaxID=9 RepID=UPI00209277C2|nr:ribosome recycling factor [Buchnera aphidicola]USS94285.1 ribosome recycling factor [Buchnera aphidicola (Sipha maydis)]WII23835.1 ribosome recycling factor [Buchnera aphidicola (Sipha maydis)]
MINIEQEIKKKMEDCIKNFLQSINKLRTGRASPDLLKDIQINYYGKKVTLENISNIIVEDSRTLRISTFDSNINSEVEKKIINSNLGLNPISVGKIIKIPIPPLTEERRLDIIKVVQQISEKSKISIRIIRRNANTVIKNLCKEKNISQNEEKKYQKNIQSLTDIYIKDIDSKTERKINELKNF